MAEECGINTYFGPLGKCEDCGKICDRPSHYPESCKTLCPDYIPKDILTSTTQLPFASNKFESENIIPAFAGVSLFLLVTCILILVWKKYLHRRYLEVVEEWRRRKLPIPTRVSLQEEAVEREQIISLNNIFEDNESNTSIIGDFEDDVMTSIDDIIVERFSNQPGAAEQPGLTCTDTVIFTNEISHNSSSEDFDFWQTFPFHSLPSLESAFENNSDQTQRKLHATS